MPADSYSEKRLVPQSGLKYITQELATKIITDEIKAVEKTDDMIKNKYKLYAIFEMITGKTYAGHGNDTQEQVEIENTFGPHIMNKTLTTPQVLMALQSGAIKYEQLPQNMKDEINKIKPRMDTDDLKSTEEENDTIS